MTYETLEYDGRTLYRCPFYADCRTHRNSEEAMDTHVLLNHTDTLEIPEVVEEEPLNDEE